jgi:hypothetical protein
MIFEIFIINYHCEMLFVPPEYIQSQIMKHGISDWKSVSYIEKLMNLNDRKYLSENLQNCLKEIDIKYIPDIIGFHRDHKDRHFQLIDLYQFEQKQIYDRSFYGMIKKFFNYLIIIISIIIIINLIFNLNNNKDEILLLKKEIMELNKKLLLSNRKDDYIIFKTK